MVDGQFGLKAWKQHITSVPSQLSAIANPHFKGFDPQHPKVTPLGHDPGNRMKIWFDIWFILFVSTHIKIGIKVFEIDFVIEI